MTCSSTQPESKPSSSALDRYALTPEASKEPVSSCGIEIANRMLANVRRGPDRGSSAPDERYAGRERSTVAAPAGGRRADDVGRDRRTRIYRNWPPTRLASPRSADRSPAKATASVQRNSLRMTQRGRPPLRQVVG